jgi:hypothetical protein
MTITSIISSISSGVRTCISISSQLLAIMFHRAEFHRLIVSICKLPGQQSWCTSQNIAHLKIGITWHNITYEYMKGDSTRIYYSILPSLHLWYTYIVIYSTHNIY